MYTDTSIHLYMYMNTKRMKYRICPEIHNFLTDIPTDSKMKFKLSKKWFLLKEQQTSGIFGYKLNMTLSPINNNYYKNM